LTLLLWSAPAFGAVILVDDFNSYDPGNLSGQGGWSCSSGVGAQVVASPVFEGSRSVQLSTFSSDTTYKAGGSTNAPKEIFYMLFPTTNPETQTACPGLGSNLGGVMLSNNDVSQYVSLHAFQCKENGLQKVIIFGYYSQNQNTIEVGNRFVLSDTAWRELGIEVDVVGRQVKFDNGGTWTAWIVDGTLTQSENKLYIDRVSDSRTSYIDTIQETTWAQGCDTAHCTLCLDESSCITANCLWWFNPMIQDYSCAPPMPTTPPSAPANWLDYYDANSDPRFDTPTNAINAVAGSLDVVFQAVNGWLYGFQNIFQVDQASANGTSLGASIPLARGYLTQIDAFFSGFPVSSLFLFAILTILVVVVYNIVKGLLQLIRG
jgi:hypothetical protein